MNNRIVLVVMTAAILSTSTGCGVFRNFLFGRGARCGLCQRLAAPAQRLATPSVPAPCGTPTCQTPTYVQPQVQSGCGCQSDPCAQGVYQDPCAGGSLYSYDPYNGGVVGSGTVINGNSGYWDNFESRNYAPYSSGYVEPGYKVDKNGDRIIHEDPLPPNATVVQ